MWKIQSASFFDEKYMGCLCFGVCILPGKPGGHFFCTSNGISPGTVCRKNQALRQYLDEIGERRNSLGISIKR